MPTTKNILARFKILDDLLGNRYHNYSITDLTEAVSSRLSEIDPESGGVVRRTIEKDLKFLESDGPFMADIERYSVVVFDKEKQKNIRKKCLRYQNPGFSIFKKEMSDDEKYILSEALSILGQFDGLPEFGALEKLRIGLNVEKNRKILSFSANPLEESNTLGELFTCISQKQVIELQYHKFGEKISRLHPGIHPYLLKEYNRRWYLIGASEEDGKMRNFALDRIDGITPRPAKKYIPYNGDISEYFEDIIGVTNFTDQPVEHIEFWVSAKSIDYVLNKPLHDSQIHYRGEKKTLLQKKYPHLMGGGFFSIDCKDNYELIRELTSYGENLVVLSPVNIRQEVEAKITGMMKAYDLI